MKAKQLSDFDIDQRFDRFHKKYYIVEFNDMIANFRESYDIDFIETVIDDPCDANLKELARIIKCKCV